MTQIVFARSPRPTAAAQAPNPETSAAPQKPDSRRPADLRIEAPRLEMHRAVSKTSHARSKNQCTNARYHPYRPFDVVDRPAA